MGGGGGGGESEGCVGRRTGQRQSWGPQMDKVVSVITPSRSGVGGAQLACISKETPPPVPLAARKRMSVDVPGQKKGDRADTPV